MLASGIPAVKSMAGAGYWRWLFYHFFTGADMESRNEWSKSAKK
jgi:hypothetical protein